MKLASLYSTIKMMHGPINIRIDISRLWLGNSWVHTKKSKLGTVKNSGAIGHGLLLDRNVKLLRGVEWSNCDAVRRTHKTRATEDGDSTYERTEIRKETFVEFLLIHSQRTTNKNKWDVGWVWGGREARRKYHQEVYWQKYDCSLQNWLKVSFPMSQQSLYQHTNIAPISHLLVINVRGLKSSYTILERPTMSICTQANRV